MNHTPQSENPFECHMVLDARKTLLYPRASAHAYHPHLPENHMRERSDRDPVLVTVDGRYRACDYLLLG